MTKLFSESVPPEPPPLSRASDASEAAPSTRRPFAWAVMNPPAAGGPSVLWDCPDSSVVISHRRHGVSVIELFKGAPPSARMGVALGSQRVTQMLLDKIRLAEVLAQSLAKLKEGEPVGGHWLQEAANLRDIVHGLAAQIESSLQLASDRHGTSPTSPTSPGSPGSPTKGGNAPS